MPSSSTGMSHAEIHRWLRACGTEPWYREQVKVRWPGMAVACGLSRQVLKYARRGLQETAVRRGTLLFKPTPTEETMTKIAQVMRLIEDGRLVFVHGGPRELVPPTTRQWPQASIVDDDCWNYWAPCRNCGGRKWSPLWMNGTPIVACLWCNPEYGWKAWGATYRPCRLVQRVLEQQPVFDERTKNIRLPEREVRPRVR